MMEVIVPPKHRFILEPHGITSQKKAFFIVTAAETSKFTFENDFNKLLDVRFEVFTVVTMKNGLLECYTVWLL
jgi:hypothetical protein